MMRPLLITYSACGGRQKIRPAHLVYVSNIEQATHESQICERRGGDVSTHHVPEQRSVIRDTGYTR